MKLRPPLPRAVGRMIAPPKRPTFHVKHQPRGAEHAHGSASKPRQRNPSDQDPKTTGTTESTEGLRGRHIGPRHQTPQPPHGPHSLGEGPSSA